MKLGAHSWGTIYFQSDVGACQPMTDDDENWLTLVEVSFRSSRRGVACCGFVAVISPDMFKNTQLGMGRNL
jgi:hypothetical protein